jgi:hypothetical protein
MLSVAKHPGGGMVRRSNNLRTVRPRFVMLSVAKHLNGGMVRRSNNSRFGRPPRSFATLSMTNCSKTEDS